MQPRPRQQLLVVTLGAGLLLAGIPTQANIVRRASADPPETLMSMPLGSVPLQDPHPTAAQYDVLEAPVIGPSGHATSAAFYSAALGRTMPYLIYLPPGYDADPTSRYPVLYLLHGLGGSETEWYRYGVFVSADWLIRSGQVAPLIVVLPEGERGYWFDHLGGGPQWGTYVANDLVHEIDSAYRTAADGQHRAIGGMSMGGYGALELAMLSPGEFGTVAVIAPALHSFDDAPDGFGDADYFTAHNPSDLITADPTDAQSLTLSISSGDADPWLTADRALHQKLLDLGVAHNWTVYPGDHSSQTWAERVDDVLRFVGAVPITDSTADPRPGAP